MDIPPSYSCTIFITGILYTSSPSSTVIISHGSRRISPKVFIVAPLYVKSFRFAYTFSSFACGIKGLSKVIPRRPSPAVYVVELSTLHVNFSSLNSPSSFSNDMILDKLYVASLSSYHLITMVPVLSTQAKPPAKEAMYPIISRYT